MSRRSCRSRSTSSFVSTTVTSLDSSRDRWYAAVRPTWPAPSITIFMGGVLYGAAMHILYGHAESGHTYKVALCLALMDETFEYRWVDVFAPREQRRADFQAVSRYGEIPVLV